MADVAWLVTTATLRLLHDGSTLPSLVLSEWRDASTSSTTGLTGLQALTMKCIQILQMCPYESSECQYSSYYDRSTAGKRLRDHYLACLNLRQQMADAVCNTVTQAGAVISWPIALLNGYHYACVLLSAALPSQLRRSSLATVRQTQRTLRSFSVSFTRSCVLSQHEHPARRHLQAHICG